MGLHGALIMEQDGDEISNKYKENILMFEWFYIIPSSICNPNNRRVCPGSDTENNKNIIYKPRFETYKSYIINEQPQQRTGLGENYAMCDIYCSFNNIQRKGSKYIYDVITDLYVNKTKIISGILEPHLMYYFVNGQLSPKINMITGEFRRLRMINSLSNWYLHFKFPSQCQWYLIATDGIYIDGKYMNYNLSNPSHNYQYIISPGGRADFLVKCMFSGTYLIKSTNDTKQDPNNLEKLPERIYGGRTLFKLEVIDGTIKNITTTKLPTSVPLKEKNSYIEDLTDLDYVNDDINSTDHDQLETECQCNYFNKTNKECKFSFLFIQDLNGEFLSTVNGKKFEILSNDYPYLSDSLMLIRKNKPYEFIIDNNGNFPLFDVGHVYHQHINPFQVIKNIGKNGFFALESTWWDTLGNLPQNKNEFIKMRFWTRDYNGLIILHCHLLQHEDQGMMGFYVILDDDQQIEIGQTCPNQM